MRTARPHLAVTDRALSKRSELERMRRAGSIPASLYGGTEPPVNVQVNERALGAYLSRNGTGAILELDFGGASTPVIVKEIHRKPTTDAVMHVAFQRIVMANELKTSVPLRYEGVEALMDKGLVLQIQMDSLELHGRADQLPDSLTVDVSHLEAGDVVHVGSIVLPEGIALQKDANTAAASVGLPRSAVAEADAPPGTPAAAPAAAE